MNEIVAEKRKERPQVVRVLLGVIVGFFLAFAWIVGFKVINAGVGHLLVDVLEWKPWKHEGGWEELQSLQTALSIIWFDVLPWIAFGIILFAKLKNKIMETAFLFMAAMFTVISLIVCLVGVFSP